MFYELSTSTYFTGTIIWPPKLYLLFKNIQNAVLFKRSPEDCTKTLKTKFPRSYPPSIFGDTRPRIVASISINLRPLLLIIGGKRSIFIHGKTLFTYFR